MDVSSDVDALLLSEQALSFSALDFKQIIDRYNSRENEFLFELEQMTAECKNSNSETSSSIDGQRSQTPREDKPCLNRRTGRNSKTETPIHGTLCSLISEIRKFRKENRRLHYNSSRKNQSLYEQQNLNAQIKPRGHSVAASSETLSLPQHLLNVKNSRRPLKQQNCTPLNYGHLKSSLLLPPKPFAAAANGGGGGMQSSGSGSSAGGVLFRKGAHEKLSSPPPSSKEQQKNSLNVSAYSGDISSDAHSSMYRCFQKSPSLQKHLLLSSADESFLAPSNDDESSSMERDQIAYADDDVYESASQSYHHRSRLSVISSTTRDQRSRRSSIFSTSPGCSSASSSVGPNGRRNTPNNSQFSGLFNTSMTTSLLELFGFVSNGMNSKNKRRQKSEPAGAELTDELTEDFFDINRVANAALTRRNRNESKKSYEQSTTPIFKSAQKKRFSVIGILDGNFNKNEASGKNQIAAKPTTSYQEDQNGFGYFDTTNKNGRLQNFAIDSGGKPRLLVEAGKNNQLLSQQRLTRSRPASMILNRFDEEKIPVVAQKSGGGMRRKLSMFADAVSGAQKGSADVNGSTTVRQILKLAKEKEFRLRDENASLRCELHSLKNRNNRLINQLQEKSALISTLGSRLDGQKRELSHTKRIEEILKNEWHEEFRELRDAFHQLHIVAQAFDLCSQQQIDKSSETTQKQQDQGAFKINACLLDRVEALQRENFALINNNHDHSALDSEARLRLDLLPSYDALYSFTVGLVKKLGQLRDQLEEYHGSLKSAEMELLRNQFSTFLYHHKFNDLMALKSRLKAKKKRPYSYHGETKGHVLIEIIPITESFRLIETNAVRQVQHLSSNARTLLRKNPTDLSLLAEQNEYGIEMEFLKLFAFASSRCSASRDNSVAPSSRRISRVILDDEEKDSANEPNQTKSPQQQQQTNANDGGCRRKILTKQLSVQNHSSSLVNQVADDVVVVERNQQSSIISSTTTAKQPTKNVAITTTAVLSPKLLTQTKCQPMSGASDSLTLPVTSQKNKVEAEDSSNKQQNKPTMTKSVLNGQHRSCGTTIAANHQTFAQTNVQQSSMPATTAVHLPAVVQQQFSTTKTMRAPGPGHYVVYRNSTSPGSPLLLRHVPPTTATNQQNAPPIGVLYLQRRSHTAHHDLASHPSSRVESEVERTIYSTPSRMLQDVKPLKQQPANSSACKQHTSSTFVDSSAVVADGGGGRFEKQPSRLPRPPSSSAANNTALPENGQDKNNVVRQSSARSHSKTRNNAKDDKLLAANTHAETRCAATETKSFLFSRSSFRTKQHEKVIPPKPSNDDLMPQSASKAGFSWLRRLRRATTEISKTKS